VDVVEGADDRAARDGRDHLDVPQQAALRGACEHPDVEEGGPEASSREGEAELGLLPAERLLRGGKERDGGHENPLMSWRPIHGRTVYGSCQRSHASLWPL
jgi:hypothetical protein